MDRSKTCPMFILPDEDDPPHLPIEQMSKVSPKDKNAMLDILATHIADNKKYRIAQAKKRQLAYDEYLRACR
jgi:hypothetical protein